MRRDQKGRWSGATESRRRSSRGVAVSCRAVDSSAAHHHFPLLTGTRDSEGGSRGDQMCVSGNRTSHSLPPDTFIPAQEEQPSCSCTKTVSLLVLTRFERRGSSSSLAFVFCILPLRLLTIALPHLIGKEWRKREAGMGGESDCPDSWATGGEMASKGGRSSCHKACDRIDWQTLADLHRD